jgi:hypothetical protein
MCVVKNLDAYISIEVCLSYWEVNPIKCENPFLTSSRRFISVVLFVRLLTSVYSC